MNKLSDKPFFLPPHKGEPGGVDYLGLRAINLQMMDDMLPGLNNVARSIRPFALLAWTIWTYERHCLEHSQVMSSSAYLTFREKIEALFVLSHKLAGLPTGGVPGADQSSPSGPIATLQFTLLNRSKDTTLIHATSYGPGLKSDFGLRFAYATPEAPGIFRVLPAGERLAIAFDTQLRRTLTPDQYRFLRDPVECTISMDEAVVFAQSWRVDMPTPEEQEAFFARLSPDNDKGPREQGRAAMVTLIRTVLAEAAEPLTVHELRRALAMHSPAALSPALVQAKTRWQVLQLRQAQRLALEVLFGWVERCIWRNHARTTEALCELMNDSLWSARPDWNPASLIQDRLGYFRSLASCCDALWSRGLTDPECDVVGLAAKLEKKATAKNWTDEMLVEALDILILVGAYTEHFLDDTSVAPYVSNPVIQRLPLQWWAKTLRSHADLQFPRFAQRLIETWLISQHLGVAAARLSDDSGRMRLSIDDAGICSLLQSADKCWTPMLSADRLETAVSLLHECGCLSRYVDGDGSLRFSVLPNN